MEDRITIYKADEVAIYPSGPSHPGLNGPLQITIHNTHVQPFLYWTPDPSLSAPPFTHMLGAIYQSISHFPTYPFQMGGPLEHSIDPTNPDLVGETKCEAADDAEIDEFFDLESEVDQKIKVSSNDSSISPSKSSPLSPSHSPSLPHSASHTSSATSSTPSKKLEPKPSPNVSHTKVPLPKDLPPETYSFKYSLSDISSIQRLSGSPISTTKLRVMLTGGVVLPELYFFEGDVDLFMKKMETFTIFRESEHDPDVFYVTHSGLGRGADKNPIGIADFMKSMNENVADYLHQTPRPLVSQDYPSPKQIDDFKEEMGKNEGDSDPLTASEMDFVVIEDELQKKIVEVKNRIEVKRYREIEEKEWHSYFDHKGRLCVDKSVVLNRIFSSGVTHSIRSEVWKFLLGMYPWNSDAAGRREILKEKEAEYETYKRQWKSFTEPQIANFKKFRTRVQGIQKDVPRTDRSLPFYFGKNNPNLAALENVLVTYSFFNFDLGYCQGMNDLLSPILYVMEGREAESFWCFVSFMDRVERYFGKGQVYMQSQLKEVSLLLRQVDPAFHEFLITNHSDNFFFCFRWLLCQFKREYSFQDTMRLWEVMWTDVCAPKFDLFIVFVTILKLRNKILSEEMSFDEILKHCNDMSGTLDVEEILVMAEYAFRYWQQNVDHLSFPTVDAPLPKYKDNFHDYNNDE